MAAGAGAVKGTGAIAGFLWKKPEKAEVKAEAVAESAPDDGTILRPVRKGDLVDASHVLALHLPDAFLKKVGTDTVERYVGAVGVIERGVSLPAEGYRSSVYPLAHLLGILQLAKRAKVEYIRVSVAKDYPLVLERVSGLDEPTITDDERFSATLAPRTAEG